jgi:hypothetical protein
MPLFQINGAKLSLTRPTNFNQEKEIQALIEKNLETVFNCRFVASEFSTGSEHAGRIDTLAWDPIGSRLESCFRHSDAGLKRDTMRN